MKKNNRSIMLIMLLAVAVSCAGCAFGPKPEETVTKFMDSMKKCDWDAMAVCVKDGVWEGKDEELINESHMSDYFSSTLSKLTYTVGTAKVDKVSATVPVKIKYFDATDLLSEVMGEYLTKAMGMALTGEEITDEKASQILGELLSKKAQDLPDTFDEVTIDMECVRENGQWFITQVDDDMLNVVTSNFNKVSEDMGTALDKSSS